MKFDKNKPYFLKTTFSKNGGYRYYFKQDEDKPFKRISQRDVDKLHVIDIKIEDKLNTKNALYINISLIQDIVNDYNKNLLKDDELPISDKTVENAITFENYLKNNDIKKL